MAKDGHFIKTKQTLIYIKLFRSARKYFFSSKFNSRSVSETKKIIVSSYTIHTKATFSKI